MLRRESMVTTEERLLFDILQELREIKQLLQPQEVKAVRPIAKGAGFKCKTCGKEFDNKGSLMGCYRKHKKEEGAKSVN